MKKLLTILLLLISLISYSATFNSIQNGDWNNDNTWDGSGIPSSNGDIIHIYHAVVMTNDITFSFDSLIIYSGGSLIGNYDLMVKANCYFGLYNYLEVCDLEFANGSVVYVDYAASIQVNCNLTNNNNSDGVIINGSITINGTFDNGTGGVVGGGGVIIADDYTGGGTTFGHEPTDSIPPGVPVTENPVPIILYTFYAICNDDGTKEICWQTLSEINSDKFELYRSLDAVNYDLIHSIQSLGSPTFGVSYSVMDNVIYIGNVYYKLKQMDFNGQFEEFSPTGIYCDYLVNINFYPNPSKVGQAITYTGDIYHIQVYDIVGREVKVEIRNYEIIGLAKGVYILYINGKLQIKIIVE